MTQAFAVLFFLLAQSLPQPGPIYDLLEQYRKR